MNADRPAGMVRHAVAAAAVTVAVFYAASFFPEARLWGINVYGFFSWYGPLLLLVLGLAALWPAIRSSRAVVTPPKSGSGRRFILFSLCIVVLSAVAFIAFEARTHFLGHGYELQSWLQQGLYHKPWEQGTVAVQRVLHSLLDGAGSEAAALALRLSSWGSGVAFLAISAVAALLLFEDNARRLLFLGGLATGGYMLLFFGYFESYPVFTVTVLLFSVVGLLAASGRLHRLWILPVFILAALCNALGISLLPAAIYVLMRGTALSRRLGRLSTLTKQILTGALVVAGLGVLIYFYLNDFAVRFTIVPVFDSRFAVQGYSMFSVKHVLDFLNLLLVLLPGLLVFLAAVVWSRRREVWSRPDGIYLLLLTIPPLVTVFMLNPTLGMPRDWDLFSFTGIPLNLLFYYTALNAPWEPKAVRIVAWLGVALGVIGLAPRVASQAVPQVGTALFDAYANLDPVRSRSGRYWELKYFDEQGDHDAYQAHARANRVALPHETWVNEAVDLIREGQVSDARTLLEQAIDYAPNYPYAWSNLGTIYEQDGRYDSALVCFMIADALQPFNAVVYDNTAKVFADLEKYGQAERYWRKALAVDSVHYSAALSLVRLWDRQGEAGKLDSALTALRTDDSLPLDIVIGFTALEVERSDWPGARYWLARAVLCGADTASVRKLREAHPELNPQP